MKTLKRIGIKSLLFFCKNEKPMWHIIGMLMGISIFTIASMNAPKLYLFSINQLSLIIWLALIISNYLIIEFSVRTKKWKSELPNDIKELEEELENLS